MRGRPELVEGCADHARSASIAASADFLDQPGGVRTALIPASVQVRLEFVEQVGAVAGSVVDQQFLRRLSAREPAGGDAHQAQSGTDGPDGFAFGQQRVNLDVAFPGAYRDAVVALRRVDRPAPHGGGNLTDLGELLLVAMFDRCAEMGPVPGNGALDGFAEVVPELPAIRDLDRIGCMLRRAA
ncbi:hypothetical protein [Nocardia sp. NPDC004750]